MDKQEIRRRHASSANWLKFNRLSPHYFKVLDYNNRLLTLLYSKQ